MHNIINNKSLVLGVMSGTSMDGIDISCARYYQKNNTWKFELLNCETFSYKFTFMALLHHLSYITNNNCNILKRIS